MANTKELWYKAGLSAEDNFECYVHLTKVERKAVKKFIDQLNGYDHVINDGTWCGSVWCDDTPADVDFKIEEN